ncbi:hypothetical protein [Marinobacter salinexigens]|uniref:hypothetical protein n=1 Tax=Marinobacter salinexigens TaxID=2919747 RepID=UPI00165EF550|nr:hypothetical protein [Marinobacter salinexigens]
MRNRFLELGAAGIITLPGILVISNSIAQTAFLSVSMLAAYAVVCLPFRTNTGKSS